MNGPAEPDKTDRLRAEIERTRDELGETVQALTHKMDVPARARDQLHDTRDAAQRTAMRMVGTARRRPVPVVAVLLALVVLAGLRRRRSR